jgi:2-oxo-4-hydroxy-4-carboxy-5-ureidoimidazoline decarboxylase
VNASEFVAVYGGIYEHSPWVAERVHAVLGEREADAELLTRLMADCVDNAAVEAQLELIRAHPDLAGKAQVAGELTPDSTEEQSRAGLDQCSTEEFELFQLRNAAYKEKFEFPFIKAVRNSNRVEILEAFISRLENDYNAEFETALQEIHKIARLRLTAMENAG